MQIQNLTRSHLIAATRQLDERAASQPLTETLSAPYPEVQQRRDEFQSWGPKSAEHLGRERLGSINEDFRYALNRLKGETKAEMLEEVHSSKAASVAKTAHKVACWSIGLTMVVGVPVAVLGGLDMLAGAFNLLAWPAQATGPGMLSGAGMIFAGMGVGLATFGAAATISELAENRAEAYKEVPARLAQWEAFNQVTPAAPQ